MLSGHVFRQQMWAPAIGVIGGGVLPTPVAKDDGKTPEAHLAMKARMKGGPRYTITSLAVLARNGMEQPTALPTPQARDHKTASKPGSARMQRKQEQNWSPSLEEALLMLPTPTTNDSKNASLPPSQAERDGLDGAMLRDDSIPTGAATYLNPSFVEEMMGFPVGWTA